jgi:DNA-binding beta-propeller fold protein YncE
MGSPRERRRSAFLVSARTRPLIFVAGLGLALWAVAARGADSSTFEFVQTIDLKGKAGGLDHMTLDAPHQRLFVANKTNNTLDVVDVKGGKLLRQIRGQSGVQGLAYAPDVDRLFAALGGGGLVNVFEGDRNSLVKTIKVGEEADNVRYHQPTGRVFVAHAEAGMGILDAKELTELKDIKLPAEAEAFQFDMDNHRLFANTPSTRQVLVIDTEKNDIVGNYPVKMADKNFAMAFDAGRKRLFIGCRKPGMVVVMDSTSGQELKGIEIPEGVDDLWLDAKRKRLYASCGEGFLVTISLGEGDTYEVVEKIPTAKGASTSFFDAETSRLYLGVPRQEGKQGPEIRVFQAKP